MGLILSNNATSVLAASIASGDTSLSIDPADADQFPVLGDLDWFPLTIVDASGNMEIVKATARAGAVITVERAQEGTSSRAFPAGARVDVRFTSGSAAGMLAQTDAGFRTERLYGAAADNSSDDSSKINGLVSWAKADSLRRKVGIIGRVFCASDIPDIHAVQFEGPGSVRIGTGPEYFVAPNKINRGFSALNNLYVDPAIGSDLNSGLAPEFAFKTVQRAYDVLALKGTPVQGYWQINLAEGVYRETQTSTFSIQSMRGQPIYIKGPAVNAWSIAAKPPAPTSISAITAANPPVVTSNGHGLANGDKVFIGLATKSGGGAHESDGKIYTVGNVTTNTYELSGVDGTAWSAYGSGGKTYALKGSRPKAIFYGTGNGSGWGIQFDGNGTFWAYDLMGVNYGTKAGQGDEGLLIGRTFANVRTFNIHAYDCSKYQEGRDQSVVIFSGGWVKDCFTGEKAIDARYTFGAANPTSILDTAILHQNCTIGSDMWEMSNGHCDGNTYIDCTTEIWVRKNSHAVAVYNQLTNSGGAKQGIIVSDGGYLSEANNSFTGDYRSTIVRKNGGHLESDANTRVPAVEVLTTIPTVTAGGGETTLMSTTIRQGMMQAAGDGLRVKVLGVGTWSANTVLVKVKLGSAVLCSWTMAANAAPREVKLEAAIRVNGFKQIVADTLFVDLQSNVTQTPAFDIITGTAFDTSAGDQTLSVTAQINAASGDTFIGRLIEIERSGW